MTRWGVPPEAGRAYGPRRLPRRTLAPHQPLVTCLALTLLSCTSSSAPDAAAEREAAHAEAIARLLARFGTQAQVDDLDVELQRVRAGLRTGRIELDREVLERCLEARSASPLWDDQWSPCAGLFRGQTAPGGQCDTSHACRDGFCLKGPALCGVCVARAPAGAPCNAFDKPCVPGTSCVLGVCTAPVPSSEGGPCPCVEGLRCAGAQPTAVCIRGRPGGAACREREECAVGLSCLLSGVCGLASAGELCRNDLDCRAGHHCGLSAPSVCVASTEGQSCGVVKDRCAAGLTCGERGFIASCVPKREAMESCVVSSQCPLGFACAQGLCRRVMGPGASCADPATTCMEWTVCVGGRCSRRPREGEPCLDSCAGSACRAGTCVGRALGAPCSPAGDPEGFPSCGRARVCSMGGPSGPVCAPASLPGQPCDLPCDDGSQCVDGTCRAACVLGDGAARDDFFGPGTRPPEDGGCLQSGPPSLVIPLSEAQAACAFGSEPSCRACHRAGGCWELRPRGVFPPSTVPALNPACGIDAGR